MLEGILSFLLVVVIIFLLFKFVFKFALKTIIKIIINSVIGFIILTICNLIPGIAVDINILTALVAGIFGIPGALVIIILTLLGVI